MWIPGPTQRTTPESWKAFGCLVIAVSLFCIAVGLYGGLKTGFDNPDVLRVLVGGASLCVATAAVWYAVRRWVG